jgi:hypothetical protein
MAESAHLRSAPRALICLEWRSKSAWAMGFFWEKEAPKRWLAVHRSFGPQVASAARGLFPLRKAHRLAAKKTPWLGFLGRKADTVTWIALKMLMGDKASTSKR